MNTNSPTPIVEYGLCIKKMQDFVDGMNECLARGYQPYGDPFVYGEFLCQALVKYS